MTQPSRTARDVGIAIGRMAPGPHNAITDVPGVQVGHCTVSSDKEPVAKTGVTVVLPNGPAIFRERVAGGAFVLNGAGELAGITQVDEWGLIETPIALTNTMSVGTCSAAIVNHMMHTHQGIGDEHDVVIPLVGECDDSWLNDVSARHITYHHLHDAIEQASGGPVLQGSVGAGTGMITCDLKSGIGSSSRTVTISREVFTIGVLVLSNFGELHELRLDGAPFGRHLEEIGFLGHERRRHNYGSIISVVATDAPLLPKQLERLAKRSALGIGRCGSSARHGSGEIVLAFSTSNTVSRDKGIDRFSWHVIADRAIDPLYTATIDATEEAILNALFASHDTTGRLGRFVPGIPVKEVQNFLARF